MIFCTFWHEDIEIREVRCWSWHPWLVPVEAEIFIFFSRKNRFFRAKLYTGHPNFDIWANFENSKFFRLWPNFSLFSTFWPPRPRKSLSPTGGPAPRPGPAGGRSFQSFIFREKNAFFGRNYTPDTFGPISKIRKFFDFGGNFHFFSTFSVSRFENP